MKRIECIVMDWAGSAVDYGCFAPVAAFLKAFSEIGFTLTMDQVRRPMGMAKIDHIRELFRMDDVPHAFKQMYGREWTEDDVTEMNRKFETHLFASLEEYTEPIPGVIDILDTLRKEGIKIGSTTGYTRAMMEVVRPSAASKGYVVDNCVTPDGLPAGRPQPYMIYRNMIDMSVPSVQSVLKYGDTIADIKEGVNAGVWTIGVVMGSSEMGLTIEEAKQVGSIFMESRKAQVRARMLEAGAHYVIDTIEELPCIVNAINKKLNY